MRFYYQKNTYKLVLKLKIDWLINNVKIYLF